MNKINFNRSEDSLNYIATRTLSLYRKIKLLNNPDNSFAKAYFAGPLGNINDISNEGLLDKIKEEIERTKEFIDYHEALFFNDPISVEYKLFSPKNHHDECLTLSSKNGSNGWFYDFHRDCMNYWIKNETEKSKNSQN